MAEHFPFLLSYQQLFLLLLCVLVILFCISSLSGSCHIFLFAIFITGVFEVILLLSIRKAVHTPKKLVSNDYFHVAQDQLFETSYFPYALLTMGPYCVVNFINFSCGAADPAYCLYFIHCYKLNCNKMHNQMTILSVCVHYFFLSTWISVEHLK